MIRLIGGGGTEVADVNWSRYARIITSRDAFIINEAAGTRSYCIAVVVRNNATVSLCVFVNSHNGVGTWRRTSFYLLF